MPKRRTQKIGGSQEVNPDDVTQSGDKLLADTQTLDQIISDSDRKNQTAIFSSLLGQFNNLSQESIENINKIRRDILQLEQNKFKIETRHQHQLDEKKKNLELLILNESKLNDSVEKLIQKHDSVLSQLKEKSEIFFERIRERKKLSPDYMTKLIYEDDIQTLYPMNGGGFFRKNRNCKLSRKRRNLNKKSFKLSGGMNNLVYSYQPEMDNPREIEKDIRLCQKKYLKLKDSLNQHDQEFKRNQGAISIYSNLVQKELEKENTLIRQRKKLRYQTSDLISNSDNIVQKNSETLNDLVEFEKSESEKIRDKKKKILMIKNLPVKIQEHIGHVFENLINPYSDDDKKKEKMITIYNYFKSSPFSSDNDLFYESLNTYLSNYLLKNFKNLSEEKLDNILSRLKTPDKDKIKSIFLKREMTGGAQKKGKLFRKSFKNKKSSNLSSKYKKIKSLSIKK